MFRLLGYRFSPRLANIDGTRFWRVDPQADHGKLNVVSQHRLKLQRIAPHWDDMLRDVFPKHTDDLDKLDRMIREFFSLDSSVSPS